MSDFNFPTKYLFKEVSPRVSAKKARQGLCKHFGCSNTVMTNRRQCILCRDRLKVLKNPQQYAYRQLKRSAKKRSIPFNLTFEEFQKFDNATNYVKHKGRDKESLTVDRVDCSIGYQLDNIRALTHEANSKRLADGLTDPIEPIAQALALVAGETNWHKFKKIAVDALYKAELIQASNEGGYDLLQENDPNYTPF
ncbi:hypothetical protein OAB00_01340 [Akkermansiaceae bacterium]|nr:hypothetical protein [Akkermansiaceae bacterium]